MKGVTTVVVLLALLGGCVSTPDQPSLAPVAAQAPATAPSVVARPQGVPAPQLSNFRPTPVVPLALARSASTAPPTSLPPARAAAGVDPAVPAVRTAAAPTGRQTADVAQAAVPAVAAAPAVVAPPVKPAAPPPANALATLPPPAKTTVVAEPPRPANPMIEMRPGRLIVPDDGGFIRVEPISEASDTASMSISAN